MFHVFLLFTGAEVNNNIIIIIIIITTCWLNGTSANYKAITRTQIQHKKTKIYKNQDGTQTRKNNNKAIKIKHFVKSPVFW